MANLTNKGTNVLTPREKEILKLVASGYSNSDAGKMLNISPRTVSTHRTNINRKLHVNNIVGLVRYALKHEIIT